MPNRKLTVITFDSSVQAFCIAVKPEKALPVLCIDEACSLDSGPHTRLFWSTPLLPSMYCGPTLTSFFVSTKSGQDDVTRDGVWVRALTRFGALPGPECISVSCCRRQCVLSHL